MQEQDERLCLESLVLEPVPRNQRDRLVRLVVVERNRFLGGVRPSWFQFVRVHFHPAGGQEDLLEPGDEGGPALGDQAVLQHLQDKILVKEKFG